MFKQLFKMALMSVIALIFFDSCQKNSDISTVTEKSESATSKKVLSEAEIKLRSKLERRMLITMEVMKDKSIQQLFVEAVKSKTKASYRNEEAITFKELFNKNGRYPALSERFSKRFLEVYYEHNYFKSEKFPKPDNSLKGSNGLNTRNGDDFLDFNDGSQLYFPYSEFHTGYTYTPTYSYAPLDNEFQNEGYINTNNVYNAVAVDDTYTQQDANLYCKC